MGRERCAGRADKIDGRSEIFALGAMLIERLQSTRDKVPARGRAIAARWVAVFVLLGSAAIAGARDDAGQILAQRWAPLLRQEISRHGGHGLNGRADLLAAIDYDGDWDPRNNWENLPSYPLSATVYWSLASTATHHYVLYLFYHPRDWTGRWFSPRFLDSEHENDLEAVVFMLRRSASTTEQVEAALCVHHSQLRALLPRGSQARARNGVEILRLLEVDGVPRPVMQSESRGHALLARAQYHWLWPNTTINIEPGRPNLSIDVTLPTAAGRTIGFTDYWFGPDVSDAEKDELFRFSQQVGHEDAALVAGVQAGLDSGMVPQGRILPLSEQLIGHFHRLVYDTVAG